MAVKVDPCRECGNMATRHICRTCVWEYKNGLIRDLSVLDDLLPSYDRGEWVTILAGPHSGESGRVIGFDDYHGETIVQLTDGRETIAPDDALTKK